MATQRKTPAKKKATKKAAPKKPGNPKGVNRRKALADSSDPELLTEQLRLWVEAYMGEAQGNAGKATRLAGYGCTTSGSFNSLGHKILGYPVVKAAIKARAEDHPLVKTRLAIQVWWSKVIADDSGKYALKDRLKASEMLTRTRGEFVDKSEVKLGADDDGPVKVNVYLPANGRRGAVKKSK